MKRRAVMGASTALVLPVSGCLSSFRGGTTGSVLGGLYLNKLPDIELVGEVSIIVKYDGEVVHVSTHESMNDGVDDDDLVSADFPDEPSEITVIARYDSENWEETFDGSEVDGNDDETCTYVDVGVRRSYVSISEHTFSQSCSSDADD